MEINELSSLPSLQKEEEDEDAIMIPVTQLNLKLRAIAGFSPESALKEVQRLAYLSGRSLRREMEPLDHIQKLPVELMAEVLILNYDVERQLEDEPKSHLIASLVCQRWRKIVTGTPQLWRWIDVVDKPPWPRTRLHLERASTCPLRIKLEWDDFGLEEDTVPRTVDDLSQALDLLVPFVEQWETFTLDVTQYTLIYHALSRLEHLKAPILRELNLTHQDEEEASLTFGPKELAHPFKLFNGSGDIGMKSLKILTLWGVHVDWTSRPFSQLRSLTLAYHAMDVRPSSEDFFAMLAESAETLHDLTFEFTGPAEDAEWPSESIAFPALRHLKLAFIPPVDVQNLLTIIDAPDLYELIFDLDDGDGTSTMVDWARIVEVICTAGYHATSAPRTSIRKRGVQLFPSLHALQLRGLPADLLDYGLLLYFHPTIKDLTLDFRYIPEEFLDFLWQPIPASLETYSFTVPTWVPQGVKTTLANTEAKKEDLWIVPELKTVRVYGLDGGQLRRLVDGRKNAGMPLSEIYYSDGCTVTARDSRALSENLDKFEEFEETDVEDEGEDLEEEEEEEEEDEEDGDDDDDEEEEEDGANDSDVD